MRVPEALALALACSACIDIELVAPVRQPDPELFISWRLTQDSANTLSVSAFFWPGAEFVGVPLSPEAELQLDGEPVPTAESSTGHWSYNWRRDLAQGVAAAPVSLLIPARGGTVAARTFELPAMQRVGPAEFTVAAGEDVRLQIADTPAPASVTPLYEQWSVRVASSCQGADQTFAAFGSGKPPADILVPRQWLNNIVGRAAVCLQYQYAYRPESALYTITISRFVDIEWYVTLSP